MTDRSFVEQVLRLNNVPPDASEADLRALFARAAWSAEDIEEAIKLCASALKEDPEAASASVSVFRPDRTWSSDQISSLLGVSVATDPAAPTEERVREVAEESAHTLYTFMLASACALGVVFLVALALVYFFGLELPVRR